MEDWSLTIFGNFGGFQSWKNKMRIAFDQGVGMKNVNAYGIRSFDSGFSSHIQRLNKNLFHAEMPLINILFHSFNP